jgi:methyl-accepting chemotaxis protein
MTTQQINRSSTVTSEPPPGSSFVRWLWIWVTLGIIVVVVVIGFLIGIVRALESIDVGLFSASSSVAGATGDVTPLPGYIQTINSALTDIDTSLKPITGQVGDATASLLSIRGSLQSIDASLKDTSASLVNTSGSLTDTSGALVSISGSVGSVNSSLIDTSNILLQVLRNASAIELTLESIQNENSQGTALIFQQVGFANEILQAAQNDTSTINLQLQETNDHLTNICTSPTLSLLPPFRCTPEHP